MGTSTMVVKRQLLIVRRGRISSLFNLTAFGRTRSAGSVRQD